MSCMSFFFSSSFTLFFSVTCCSQLSILAVLLVVSLPGSCHVVAVVKQERSLISDSCTQERGVSTDEFELACEDWLFFVDSSHERLTLNIPSIIYL